MNQRYSSKTIFIVDNSNEYSTIDSGQKHDFGSKFRCQISVISKSLFTCTMEAIFDYSRIVWDLFPNGEKLLFYIACSSTSTYRLNDGKQQNFEHLFNSFMQLPPSSSTTNVIKNKLFLIEGIRQALQCLSLETTSSSLSKYDDDGARIMLFTFIDEDIDNFIIQLKKEIGRQLNDFRQNNLLINLKLDIIIINSYPLELEKQQQMKKDLINEQLNEWIKFSFLNIASSSIIASRLICMAFEHYDLSSTTVCNIPMKEEQNSGTSANYDVEIIHSREAHDKFFQSQILFNNNNNNNNNNSDIVDNLYQYVERDKQKYQTLKLKWATTTKTADNNHCIGVYRMTAIDVSSRPSSCLLTFLLSGKTVILENNNQHSTKSITHMLRCHNGELFIHVLHHSINPSLIDDAPSISEGVGGRITDYRINEFAELMKKNQLKLIKNNQTTVNMDDNLEQSCTILKKQTKYWPISLGLTVFFNIRDKFYELITKNLLTENDSLLLREIMYRHFQNEKNNIPLPIQITNIIRLKGLKKEDLYRIYWTELEQILRCYNQLSIQHHSILQCFLDIKPINHSINNNGDALIQHNSNDNIIYNNNNIDKKQNDNQTIDYLKIKNSQEKLLDIFSTKLINKRKKSLDFCGRNVKLAKLYANINVDNDK